MMRIKRIMMWMSVVVFGIFLQIIFICVDSKSTVTKTAIEFSRSYFLIDDSMDTYISQNFRDSVKSKLDFNSERIIEMGFNPKVTKKYLYDINTKILIKKAEYAEVMVYAKGRMYINPLFKLFSRIFKLGKVYHISELLEMTKEGLEWKVSGGSFVLN